MSVPEITDPELFLRTMFIIGSMEKDRQEAERKVQEEAAKLRPVLNKMQPTALSALTQVLLEEWALRGKSQHGGGEYDIQSAIQNEIMKARHKREQAEVDFVDD